MYLLNVFSEAIIMKRLFGIDNLQIRSVIRVSSECGEGEYIDYPPVLHTYELVYFISGENTVSFADKTCTEKKGFIRFTPRNVPNDTYRVFNHKSGACVDIYFYTSTPLPREMLVGDFSASSDIESKFIKIYNMWNSKNAGYYNKCMSLFFDILSKMESFGTPGAPRAHEAKIAPAIKYLSEHYQEPDLDYKRLAALCNISYTYFRRLFVEIYRTTPRDYVKNLRLERACELLSLERFSVSAVAEMCGFSDIYYFSRVFKEHIGVPPSTYKRSSAFSFKKSSH